MDKKTVLTEEQSKVIADIVGKFTTLNESKINLAGGLIDVNSIKENYQKKADDIQRIEAVNILYENLLIQTIEKDCKKLNIDLLQLGLYAYPFRKSDIIINPIGIRGKVLGSYIIYYQCTYHNNNFARRNEYNGINMFVQYDRNKYNCIEDCMDSSYVKDAIRSMYEQFGYH